MSKIRVGVICGGKSAEHEVSLQSARNIVDALDRERFEVTVIGIDKQGQWHINDAADFLLDADDPRRIALNPSVGDIALVPGREHRLEGSGEDRLAILHPDELDLRPREVRRRGEQGQGGELGLDDELERGALAGEELVGAAIGRITAEAQ